MVPETLPLVDLKQASVVINGRRIVESASMALFPGEIVGIAGVSGSGKTTLLHAIAGTYPLASGSCVIRSSPLMLMPQDCQAALNPALTIGSQVALIEKASNMRIARFLVEYGLPEDDDLLDRYPGEISGGQCQRVVWAMVMSRRPAVIVLDEPTSALDRELEVSNLAHLRRFIADQNACALLVSHQSDVLTQVCDRTLIMDNGRLLGDRMAGAANHPLSRLLAAEVSTDE